MGRLVLYLRKEHHEGLGAEEYLALGLIALAYGAAVMVSAYGFLAVFAAGVAFRQVESRESGSEDATWMGRPRDEREEEALQTDPEHAPKQLAQSVLSFNEQLDRLGEVAVVLLVGGLLPVDGAFAGSGAVVAILVLIIRPARRSPGWPAAARPAPSDGSSPGSGFEGSDRSTISRMR